MRKRLLGLLLAAILFTTGVTAQSVQEPCIQHTMELELLSKLTIHQKNNIRIQKSELRKEAKRLLQQKSPNEDIIRIPVVFHIVHTGGIDNISEQQVIDAIAMINQDFSASNPGFANITSEFKPLAANVGIEFHLAKRDPDGMITNGITRINSNLTSNASRASLHQLRYWPRDQYMNIWVAQSTNGGTPLGYAYPPAAVADWPILDGITVKHNNLGFTGTASGNAYPGTLSHEIGHWVSLPHVWGNGAQFSAAACNSDDGIDDTPNSWGNSGCSQSNSCGTPDNFENFMDYSSCHRMFTHGQKAQMRSALNSNLSDRNNLWTDENLKITGIIPAEALAAWTQNKTFVTPSESIQYTNASISETGASITSWQWTFEGGTPNSYSGENPPSIQYNTEGIYSVTLTVTNDADDSHTRTTSELITVENAIFMQTGTFNVCDQPFYDSGLKEAYQNNENHVLTLKPLEANKKLEIEFYEFFLDDSNCSDYLEIYNGTSTSSPYVGRYCKEDIITSFLADNPDGAITFKFVSDGSSEFPGWKGKIHCRDLNYVDQDILMKTAVISICEGRFFDSQKFLNHTDDEQSTLTMNSGTPGARLVVDFLSFHLESGDCTFDNLKIYDGSTNQAPLIGTYCGQNSPGRVMATNPEGALTFTFYSDNNSSFPGWEAIISCDTSNDLYPLFTSDQQQVCPPSTIQFTDQSLGDPESWNWVFEAGTPSNSTEQNPVVSYDTPGNYSVQLIIGKEDKADTLIKEQFISVMGSNLPLTENFESGQLPTGWQVIDTDQITAWKVTDRAGKNSSYSLGMNNADNKTIGEVDEIVLPNYNVSAFDQANLRFELAYTKFDDNSKDSLLIYISSDCGANWELIFNQGNIDLETAEIDQNLSNNWEPTPEDWRKETIEINNLDENLRIKFKNVSGYGTWIYIDDIQLDGILGTQNHSSKLEIYPNPTSSLLNIPMLQEVVSGTIQISDLAGKTILNQSVQSLSSNTLDVQHLSTGTYFIQLRSPEGIYNQKFIKY